MDHCVRVLFYYSGGNLCPFLMYKFCTLHTISLQILKTFIISLPHAHLIFFHLNFFFQLFLLIQREPEPGKITTKRKVIWALSKHYAE